MQLHCLGTAGYHPSESRHTSCYLLPQSGIVLDAGTGIFRLPDRIETDSLDILLSHSHLDHIAGLTFLLDILYQRPVENVRVWGQADKLNAVQAHLTSELIFPVKLPVRWCPIDDQPTIELPHCSLSWRSQDHPGQSVAYRMDWADGRSLVYATDSNGEHDDATLQWMSRADILLHECNFHDHQKQWAIKTGHCYLGKVAEVSRATRPKRLLLTHINPIDELVLDPHDSRFDMPVEIVSDQQVIDF